MSRLAMQFLKLSSNEQSILISLSLTAMLKYNDEKKNESEVL
jgi:hypothetical protein